MIIIVTSSSISVDQIASGRDFSTTSIDSPTTVLFGPGSCTCPEFARLGDNEKSRRDHPDVFLILIFVDSPTTISSALATLVVQNSQNWVIVENTSGWSAWFSSLMFFSLYFLLHNEPIQAQSVLTQSTVKSSNFSRQLWQIHATNSTNHVQI